GAPRQLLSLLRANEVDPRAGATIGYGTAEGYEGRPFVAHTVTPPSIRPTSMIYSHETRDEFRFIGPPLNSYQLHFLQKSVELARAHEAMLVVLHIPSPAERGEAAVLERQGVSDVLGESAAFVGIPSTRLFQGIPAGEFFDY